MRFRSEAAQTGMDTRRATGGSRSRTQQCVKESDRAQRRRHAWIRRLAAKPGEKCWLRLGGETVSYLGEEGYGFTGSTEIYVPGRVVHNPTYFKRVDRPYCLVVLALIDNAKFHEGEFTPLPAPKTFRF